MKKIFEHYTFLPIRQRESLRFWYRSSSLFALSICALLLSINALQCWNLAKEMHKKSNIAATNQHDFLITQEKNELEYKKNKYTASLAAIQQLHKKNESVHLLLNSISTIIPDDVALKQINYQSNNELSLTGQALELVALDQFIIKLKDKTKATNASIGSLNNMYDAQLKKELINFKVVVTL